MSQSFRECQNGSLRVLSVATGMLRENCFLVTDLSSQESLLVDPGDNVEKIAEMVNFAQVSPSAILLTHGHFDHVGAVVPLSTKYGCNVYIHQNDTRLLRQAAFYAVRLVRKTVEVPRNVSVFTHSVPVKLGSTEIRVIETPGHTKGSVCFEIGGFAFTGDTLFFERIGPTDYPESDREILRVSVRRLLEVLGQDTVICPGHGRIWTSGDAIAWWEANQESPPQYQILKDEYLTRRRNGE